MSRAPTDQGRGAAYALAAALLFGASAPVAKVLLRDAEPLVLAGVLYLGAAIALSLYRATFAPGAGQQAPLSRSDWPLLAGMVLIGGVAGPALLLFGLQRVSGVAGSLLLNLEAVFTMGLATAFFGEHLGAREAAAGALVIGGAALLGMEPAELSGSGLGALEIAAACLCWGVDNNLTQRLSLRDPIVVAQVKTAAAGATSLVMALAMGQQLPGARTLGVAAVLGSLSYGLSLVLTVYSLRYVGAAREAAFFAVAPFAGALVAVPLFGTLPTPADWGAGLVMAMGVVLLARARHGHRHRHEPVSHEHEHLHDAHHQHAHEGGVVEPHSHVHQHDAIEHDHVHVSDHHHRHPHRH